MKDKHENYVFWTLHLNPLKINKNKNAQKQQTHTFQS